MLRNYIPCIRSNVAKQTSNNDDNDYDKESKGQQKKPKMEESKVQKADSKYQPKMEESKEKSWLWQATAEEFEDRDNATS